jgi:hypothetical protein
MESNYIPNTQGVHDPRTQGVFNNGIGNSIPLIMIFISPFNLGSQVIRPLKYNFHENTYREINNHIDRQGNLDYVPFIKNEYIKSAILPDANGINLETRDLSEYWTFVLIFNTHNPNYGLQGSFNKDVGQRLIMSGYVLGEPPVNINTNTINLNAILVTTHSNDLVINERLDQRMGAMNSLNITSHSDAVPSIINNFVNTDLNVLTPGDVFRSTSMIDSSLQLSTAATSVSGNTHQQSILFDTIENSPSFHFQGLLRSIDESRNDTLKDSYTSSIASGGFVGNTKEMFKERLMGNLHFARGAGIYFPSIARLADPSIPNKIEEILAICPNYSHIVIDREKNVRGEVRPQDDMNSPHNVFCTLIASSISTICGNEAITSVGFAYKSWVKNTRLYGKNGYWEIPHMESKVPINEQQQLYKIEAFKKTVEKSVFDTIVTVIGHFEVFVEYSEIGDIVIDLKLNDIDNNYNHGFYVSSGTLGGLHASALGDFSTLQNNALCLFDLANNIGIGQPIENEFYAAPETSSPKQNNTFINPNTYYQPEINSVNNNINQSFDTNKIKVGDKNTLPPIFQK